MSLFPAEKKRYGLTARASGPEPALQEALRTQGRLKQITVLLHGAPGCLGLAAETAAMLTRLGVGRLLLDLNGNVLETDLTATSLFAASDVGTEAGPILVERLQRSQPFVEIAGAAARARAQSGQVIPLAAGAGVPASDAADIMVDVCLTEADVRDSMGGQAVALWETESGGVVFSRVSRAGCAFCAAADLPFPVGERLPGGRRAVVVAALAMQAGVFVAERAELGVPDGARALVFGADGVGTAQAIANSGGCNVCSRGSLSRDASDTHSDARTPASDAPPGNSPSSAVQSPSSLAWQSELNAQSLREWIGTGRVVLIDVRTSQEEEIVAIAGGRRIATADLAHAAQQESWPKDQAIVLYCKSGLRSARARELLESLGFTRVAHLSGGILAWIEEIEPHLPRY